MNPAAARAHPGRASEFSGTDNAGLTADASALVAAQLQLVASGWSIGTFGAIGEFLREDGEPCTSETSFSVITARGGLRYEPADAVRARAYEVLSARPGVWHHGVVFCVPAKRAWPAGAGGISELGPDAGALREQDRGAILFDLAVGGLGSRFCVRTADDSLIRSLRDVCGARLLELGKRIWDLLLAANPQRVVLSPLGRIEVYERIADADGMTPFGPHTHLIPGLLGKKRGHSASIPVPAGMLPVFSLYPPNPVQDRMGRPKAFDAAEHAAFQALLERFGDADAWKAKRWLIDAVRSGADPAGWAPPKSRPARTACRVAMRQLRHELGDTPLVRDWAFEVGEPEDVPGDESAH